MAPRTNPIRTGQRPTGDVTGLKMEAVRERFRSTNPQAVAGAGHSYADAAAKLAEARRELGEATRYLGTRWKGPAATEALQALGKLQATADELAAKIGQTGKALQLYGEKVLPWYRSHVPEDGLIKTGGDDKYAQKLMARLNQRISQTYDGFPSHVSVDPPNVGNGSSTSAGGSGTGGHAAGGGYGSTGLGGGHRSLGGVPGGGDGIAGGGAGRDGSALPNGRDGSDARPSGGGGSGGTDLAGLSPAGGAGAGTGVGGSQGFGPGGGGIGIGLPGAGGPGGVVPGGFPPGGGGPGGTGGAGRGGRAAPGTIGAGGLPVPHGGGTGEPEKEERERTTWLTEDRDVWGGDEDSAPAVIGGVEPPPVHQDHAGIDLDDLDVGDSTVGMRDDGLGLGVADLGSEDDGTGAARDPVLDDELDLDDDLDDLLDDLLADERPGPRDP